MPVNFNEDSLSRIEQCQTFDFSKNTTFGLGGKAKKAFYPQTEEEAILLFRALNDHNEKFCILGKGSNVLAADGFYNGIIISTAKLKGIVATPDKHIRCLSGTTVPELLTFCKKQGLSGLEFLAGIPASVGGLTYMNGGAAGKFMSDVIISVSVYDTELRNLSNNQCDFGYKHSIMRDKNCIILSVLMNAETASYAQVDEKIKHYLNARKSQPKGKSCGCVFKNPEGYSAGKLIEECELKGFTYGGASVSREHANFIINDGGKASDVYSLIKIIKEKVLSVKGVVLEEEVVYIGDF